MNKREARRQATENQRSIADLRKLIADRRGAGGMSKVNRMFTLEQALDIFERGIAERDAAEVPEGLRYDVYKNCDRPSRDALIITNILRECV